MSQQSALFNETHEPALTERQQYALDTVTRIRDGISAAELGAHMHQRRGKHDAMNRCDWCDREGLSVLQELRRKGLVVQRRKHAGLWFPTGTVTKPSAAFGEFPEGF